jgi:HEAT repeat protein
LGWLAKDAVPSLLKACEDEDPTVRVAAAQAVGQVGPESLSAMVHLLKHEDKYVRRTAVWAIGKLGPLAKPALKSLCETLKDPDARTAAGAAQALGNMEAEGVRAVPALIEAMRGTNIVLCRLAGKALSQIGKPALAELIAHLSHHDPFVRAEASMAVGWIGPAAEEAVPGLVNILRTPPKDSKAKQDAEASNPDDNARIYAAQALGRIGAGAASALPDLVLALQDPCPAVNQAAQLSIRQIRGL